MLYVYKAWLGKGIWKQKRIESYKTVSTELMKFGRNDHVLRLCYGWWLIAYWAMALEVTQSVAGCLLSYGVGSYTVGGW
jgi:hypothetical protein